MLFAEFIKTNTTAVPFNFSESALIRMGMGIQLEKTILKKGAQPCAGSDMEWICEQKKPWGLLKFKKNSYGCREAADL